MLTERERQILDWIREDPSVTQREIAERASISRSSVAVHISNLARKGAILGRQYVISESPYAVIIGGANMDIAGRPDHDLVPRDSNPGTVRMSAGGAGRNIAHNMALLGCNVKFISAFGDDLHARELQDSCRSVGIEVKDSVTIPGAATSTYLFIMDETGDMQLAIADMAIYDRLTPSCLGRKLDLIERAALCVVDTNIPAESLQWLTEHVSVPLFCDPVSTAKAHKLDGILGKLHTIKPNQLEAQTLSGVEIHDEKTLHLAAQRLLDTGLEQVFISLDTRGLYCANRNLQFELPTFDSEVVNATGAGDSMMAAIAWAYLDGADLREQGLAGLATSSLCVESAGTINPAITASAVRRRMSASPGEHKSA
jgi:pseudouridine kinase